DRVNMPENSVRDADCQISINILEGNIEFRSNAVPNARSRGDDFGYGERSEGRPVRLLNRGVVAPWNYNSTGRNLGNQLRVLRQHITPNQHGLAVLANQPSHSLKLLDI